MQLQIAARSNRQSDEAHSPQTAHHIMLCVSPNMDLEMIAAARVSITVHSLLQS